ncbi:ABC-F family ATP-binding cassette domain-containing protein [Sphaerochaeta sp.]|uniref:ABC-F family ATP-binding cassette domain-containing protein n=1 Tax=Sphaerochaeta sp. TaxID=1972642 RepID=UPI002FC9C44A
MNVLSLEGVSKTLKDEPLFEGVNFGLEAGDHVALIGRNGQGKSTFLKLLAGQLVPDTGTIAMQNDTDLVLLEQQVSFPPDCTIASYLFAGNGKRIETHRLYHAALSDENQHTRLPYLTELMESLGVWNLEQEYQSLLGELNLEARFDQRMDTLSGGMQKKVALARVLAAKPTMLLLDEPTNHLDIQTIEWLEQYLKASSATIILVTHDRYFLDSVCQAILELDNGSVYLHPGSFFSYLERREERLERMQKEQDRLKTILRRELAWLKRGPKARTGKDSGRKDRIEAMLGAQMNVNEDAQKGFSSNQRRLGKKILEAEHLSKAFDGKPVIKDFSFSFTKGNKIGVVGPNGSGKTTLLDLLCGHLQADGGTLDIGLNTVFAYYDQLGRNLTSDKTLLAYVEEIATVVILGPKEVVSASKFLELFGFPPSMHRQSIALLSGGEKRRLYLVSRLLSNPNFLLLDEPTNDLDLPTMENLEQYVQDFDGCALVVSHDRAFLDQTCDELFIIGEDGSVRYETMRYSQWRERQQSEPAKKETQPVKSVSSSRRTEKKGLSYREQKEFEELEATMETLQARIQALEASFSNAQATGEGTLSERTQRYHALRKELEQLEDRWLELAQMQ